MDYIRMWWPMQDYFGLVSDRGIYVTAIDSAFSDELDARQLPAEIRDQFSLMGRPLSDGAAVTKNRAGSEWEIADGSLTYYIRKDEQSLGVYYYDELPQDYACTGGIGLLQTQQIQRLLPFLRGLHRPADSRGLLQIWLNRDYTQYAEAKGRSDLTLANMATRRPNAALHSPGCSLANVELRCGSHRRT
jgi:hypothetical protein